MTDPPSESSRAPEIVEHIPNIGHRFGDGRAEVIGIAVLDEHGRPVHLLEPDSKIVVRISVRAAAEIAQPNIGFMMRNHLGVDFAGTNPMREANAPEPREPGKSRTE